MDLARQHTVHVPAWRYMYIHVHVRIPTKLAIHMYMCMYMCTGMAIPSEDISL